MLTALSPLFMCLLVITLAISTSGLLALYATKWLGLALVLIFLGGMMVIFLYASTLSSSKKFFLPSMNGLSISCGLLSVSLLAWHAPNTSPPDSSIFSLFLGLPFPQLLFLLAYLLMTLLLVVKFVEGFKGAMKTHV